MKNILITGVCGGMGYAAARKFAHAGFRVFGIDRRPSCDLPIDYFCADITDSASIDEVRSKISAETEKLDATTPMSKSQRLSRNNLRKTRISREKTANLAN